MNRSKTPSAFRVLGQRSLHSSISHRLRNSSKVAEDDADKISLSEISESKLNQNTGVPKTIKVKSQPFLSSLGLKAKSESIDRQAEAKKGGEGEKRSVAMAFKQFKPSDLGKDHSIISQSAGEAECPNEDVQESRKRRNPFRVAGDDDRRVARKYYTVLGGEPKPQMKKRRDESFISKEKPGHVYNHYENGSGFWDCNMEGIDNEAVGVNEVWEGVGSTTLGGIEWH